MHCKTVLFLRDKLKYNLLIFIILINKKIHFLLNPPLGADFFIFSPYNILAETQPQRATAHAIAVK